MQIITQDRQTATVKIPLQWLNVFQNITPEDFDELAFNRAARSPQTLQKFDTLSETIIQKFL
jgi:hypothetical protein